MAIQLRSVGAAATPNDGGAFLLTTELPAFQPGDVAYLAVQAHQASTTMSNPAGWTLRIADTNSMRLQVWSRTLTAADVGASVTVNFDLNCVALSNLTVWSGATEAPDAITVGSGNGGTIAGPPIATTDAADVVLAIWASRVDDTYTPYVSPPSGHATAVNAETSRPFLLNLALLTSYFSPGGVGSYATGTASGGPYMMVVPIAVKPAPRTGDGMLVINRTSTLQLTGRGDGNGVLALARTSTLELITTTLPDDVVTLNPADAPHLAVEVRADLADETFTLDYSELDGDDRLDYGPEEEGGWANVVCDVTRVSTRRGFTRAQGVPVRAEAGTVDLELIDTERRFDPVAGRGAIYRGVLLRVRAWDLLEPWPADGTQDPVRWSEVLATGRIQDVSVQYVKDGPPLVTVSVVDVIGDLAATEHEAVPEPGEGYGDTLRERVQRVNDDAGRPVAVISDDSDWGYATTLAPSTLAGSAWEQIGAASDAELGRVYADRRNRLVLRGRTSELDGPIRGTLSDSHEEIVQGPVHCCYRDPVVKMSGENLSNAAQAQRRVWEGGDAQAVVAQADDLASQARYGKRSLGGSGVTTLEVARDSQAAQWVETVTAGHSEPEVRVDSVTPTAEDHREAWPAVAATDVGDRWWFRMQPEVGDPVDRMLGVLGIAHDITPDSWTVTLLTADAPLYDPETPDGWWTLGLSVLDGDDVLPDYSGSVEDWEMEDLDGGSAAALHTGRSVDGGNAAALHADPPAGRP